MEHLDRSARVGVEQLRAALAARGCRTVMADAGEITDRLVRSMIEVLTRMSARLYGRRGERNRAISTLTAVKREPGWAA